MNDKSVKTIADIAEICCVSKSTVSRALNDSPQISLETKERIRSVAEQHRFQINLPARRLSMQCSRTIGFVVHAHKMDGPTSMTDLFSMEILGAISSGLSKFHYDLLVANVNPQDPDWPSQYVDTGRVDGFILMTASRKLLQVKALLNTGAPFIVWGVPLPNQSYCSVINDNFEGGKKATEYLLAQGRQRIAFLGGPAEEYETQQRYNGYAATLQAHGQKVSPSLVHYGHWTSDSGAEATQMILEAAPDVDAIFANSDLMAIGAIHKLHERGRRVPADTAVVGYDDISLAELNDPPLTTISQNIPLVGKLLAENLIQNIETGMVANVTVPAELVVRRSA